MNFSLFSEPKRDSTLAWFTWGLGAAFFFFEYTIRVSPSVMTDQLLRDFHISAYQLGIFSAYFYCAYIIMQIPVGTLVDRFSVRYCVGLASFVCATAGLLFAVTHTFAIGELSRFLIGLTGAFAFVGALKLANSWFSAKHFGFLAGATQALGMAGAAVGAGPLSYLVEHYGWRQSLALFCFLLMLVALLMLWLVRDEPVDVEWHAAPQQSILQGFAIVLKNPYTWLNAAIIGTLFAPTAAFGELWGPTYLAHVYHIDSEVAASMVSFIFLGWAIGGPLFGWLSDRIGRRKPIIIASALFSLVFITLILYSPWHATSLLFIFAFAYGMSNVGVATCYSVACEITPQQWVGTALGFTNMASIIIGAIFQPVIGYLLVLHWQGGYHDGVPFYAVHDYKIALAAMPVMLIICLVCSCFLRESFGGLTQDR